VESVPALIAALEHPEARYWACLALAEMGAQAKDAVPGLKEVLADERPEVRLQAAIALAEIGPPAKPAVPELIKLLGDKFEGVRCAAVFALGRIGDKSAADAIAKMERSSDPAVNTLSTWAIAKMYPEDKQRMQQAIGELVAKLGDKDLNVSHMAARAITELEPPAEVIRPAMEKTISAADAETADRIFSAFASLGAKVVPLTINALKDPSLLRKERALRILGKIGAEAAPAVPELVTILQGSDAKLKAEALFVAAAIGPKADAAVPGAIAALGDADPQMQQTAGYALGKIGPAAKDAVPALKKLTSSNDELLKLTAVWALMRIGPPSAELTQMAVPMLTAALNSEREMVRIEAAMSLGDLGKAAASALPSLEKAQQDPSPNVRSAAAQAVKQIKG
jgi:HEAT repeat protein